MASQKRFLSAPSLGRMWRGGAGRGGRVLPGEVLLSQHVPGDRRVAGGGNLRRSRVADLALHSPEITQAGVMAYVVVSQGSKCWNRERERKVPRPLPSGTLLHPPPRADHHPPPTSDAKETRPRDADSSGVSSPLHPLGFLLHSPFLNPELTPVSLRKS